MSRKNAEDLIQPVLQLAGVPWGIKGTILLEYGDKYSRAAAARHKDPAKAKPLTHWDRFKEWAGEKIKWPMENWSKDMLQDYYAHLLAELSERTANDHIASLRQMFAKAEKEGRLKGNPAALVDKESRDQCQNRRTLMVAPLFSKYPDLCCQRFKGILLGNMSKLQLLSPSERTRTAVPAE